MKSAVDAVLDEVSRLGELATKGPVTERDMRLGASLYEKISELNLSRQTAAEILSHVRIYRDATMFIAVAVQLWIEGPGAKRSLAEDIPVYAERGVVAVAEKNVRALKGFVDDPDFPGKLKDCRPVARCLDQEIFPFFMVGLKRHKLKLKEHQFRNIVFRISVDAADRGMRLVNQKA